LVLIVDEPGGTSVVGPAPIVPGSDTEETNPFVLWWNGVVDRWNQFVASGGDLDQFRLNPDDISILDTLGIGIGNDPDPGVGVGIDKWLPIAVIVIGVILLLVILK